MHKSEIIKFLILRTIGNFLLLLGLVGITLTFGQALYQEVTYRVNLAKGVQFVLFDTTEVPRGGGFGELLGTGEVVKITPVATDFSIVIPKINANVRVIANVDAANYDEYMAALRKGVAHAQGTVFPGMEGNVYLFAHSTDYFWNMGRYNAVFYLLKELDVGDEIDIFFQGRRFVYTVDEKRFVRPEDVGYLTNSIGGEPRLTLQTCWPPGTTIKRLLVFAKPKGA